MERRGCSINQLNWSTFPSDGELNNQMYFADSKSVKAKAVQASERCVISALSSLRTEWHSCLLQKQSKSVLVIISLEKPLDSGENSLKSLVGFGNNQLVQGLEYRTVKFSRRFPVFAGALST